MGEKPMLMLELDEHAADAGYLTRIEAFADVLGASPVREVARFSLARPPADRDALRGRTLWIPPMHEAATPFMAAAMRACGYRAEPLPSEDPESFALGRAHTRGGECLPCPATLGTFLKAVRDSGDDPSRHALFMPSAAGPCRFGQYSTLHRMILDRLGWRDVPIVSWNSSNNYDGTDLRTRRYLWTAIVLGDLLFKMRCHSRPWEREAGSTEEVYRLMRHRIAAALEARGDVRELVREARDRFLALPREPGPRPLVGVVGEIYVRQNAFTNQHLVRCIEAAGGEAWVAPISEWIIYTGFMDSWRLRERRGSMAERFASHLRNRFLAHDEETWTRAAMPLLDQRGEPPLESSLSEGSRWFPLEFEGEAILTVGRAVEFMKAGASLVVNCAPFGCMPGTMTASVFQAVERAWGIPVASMFYDGEGDINGRVAAFVSNRSPGDRAMARLEPA